MSETLYRATPVDLEIRGDGRTIAGIAVPFDESAEIRTDRGKFNEIFRRGSFAKTIADGGRVKFLALHDSTRRLPLGQATLLREDGKGLYGEFSVSETRDGDEALTLMRDGILDALSIGFIPVKDRWSRSRDFVERIEARLLEVSAVPFPSYSGAKILAVRGDGSRIGPYLSRAQARARILKLKGNNP